MKHTCWHRFQVRLVLVAVLAPLLPVMAIGWYALNQTTQALERTVYDRRLHDTRQIALRLTGGLEKPRTDLLEIARSPHLRRLLDNLQNSEPLETSEITSVLRSVALRSNGLYKRIYLLNMQAQPVANSDPLGTLGHLQDELKVLVNGASGLVGIPGQISVFVGSPFTAFDLSGQALNRVPFAVALQTSQSTVAGVLVLELDLSSLWRTALLNEDIGGSQAVRLWLLDNQAQVLAQWPPEANQVPPDGLQDMLSTNEGIRQIDDVSDWGTSALLAHARVRPIGQSAVRWTVLRQTPLDDDLTQLQKVHRTLLLLSLLAVAFSICLVAWLAHPLVSGLRSLSVAAKRLGEGEFDVPLPMAKDLELHQMTRAFRRMRARLRRSMVEQQRTMHLLFTSQRLARTGGWHIDLVHGRHYWTEETFALHDLPAPSDRRGLPIADGLRYYRPQYRPMIQQALDEAVQRGTPIDFKAELIGESGRLRWVHVVGSAIEQDGKRIAITGAIQDVTESQQTTAQIEKLAHHDTLTDLPNRRWILNQLHFLMAQALDTGQSGALLYIDLDHFKNINDAMGHGTGDLVLQGIAKRLLACAPLGMEVARLGGDEFVIAMPPTNADAEQTLVSARQLAHRILASLDEPLTVGEGRYAVGGSVGISLYPRASQSVDDLLREADTAMYRAKAQGRGRVVVFADAMHAEVEQRLAFQIALKQALQLDQLRAFVQPQVDVHGQLVGAELLMRWQHPVHGMVPPAQFIPQAEESGLILPMGQWMLMQACQALVDPRRPAVPLSVNVSPQQFRQPGFVDQVAEALAQTGADGRRLILEVTEGLFMQDVDACVDRMQALQAMGVRFSIDDFGTGYSSLSYLKILPLYELKIDRSFVRGLPGETQDHAIVQTILALAKSLGLEVVAEGVETPDQAKVLVDFGCHRLQGYLYAKPMALTDWV